MARNTSVVAGATSRVSGVSLLFCDLVGSTALLAQVGEEMNDEIRRDLFEALRQPVRAFHGAEVKSQGDGLMVAFRRSIDDAVGCAVAMQQAVGRLSSADGCPRLAIRVGISMGEVTSEEHDWFGTPVVEAARLCALAKPSQILVTDHACCTSHRRPAASARPVGQLTLKGFPHPVACSEILPPAPEQVVASAPLPPMFDLCGHAPLVGTDDHLATVRGLWRHVIDGQSRTVVVTGPPRSGKTRFAAEVVHMAANDSSAALGIHVVSMQLSRRGMSCASVIGDAFRRHVMWGPVELVKRLAGVPGLASYVPTFTLRLGDGAPSGADPQEDNPSVVLTAAIHQLAQDKPVVVVVEDGEWATPEVAELLNSAMKALAGDRVLFLITRRDTGDEPTDIVATLEQTFDDLGASRIVLAPLSRLDVGRLVGAICSDAVVRAETAESIVDVVGGVAGDVIDAIVRLQTHEGSGSHVSVRRALSPCVPYKGLLALAEDDDAVLFGRGELVEQVLDRLSSKHFVALVGASGSGKSSVLRAGVASALRSAGTSVTVVTPTDRDLIRAAATGALQVGTLIIDQFEEFFTLWSDKERTAVIENLFSAVSFGPIEAIAVGIRSDFFAQCGDHLCLVARLGDATVLVGALTDHELLTMIEGPADAGGLDLDAGFAAMIKSELGDERHPLPLLSHTLFETWRRRAVADRLTVDDYRDAGGVRGSIARTAERVFTVQLDRSHQRCARDLLLRLVEPGDQHTPATRRPEHVGVLADTFGELGDEVIDVFVRARLLVADDDMIDLAHEAILSEWPRLAGWIADDREHLVLAAHLTAAAADWVTKNRPQTDLYRGSRLDSARELVETGRPLTPSEREFIAASTELRDRERVQLRRTNRRLRRQLAAASIAAVLAIGATVAAVAQQRTANRQRHQAQLALLASTATDLASARVDVGALLAVEANRLLHTATSLGALQTVLRTQPSIVRSLYPDFLAGGATLVATSADARVVAFAGNNSLTIVDTATQQPRATIPTDGTQAPTLSPSGDQFAVVGDGHITVNSTANGARVANITLAEDEAVLADQVSWVDASHLFFTSNGGRSRVVDITTEATTQSWRYRPTGFAIAAPSIGVFADFPRETAVPWRLTEHTATGDVTYNVSNTDAGFDSYYYTTEGPPSYSPNGRWLAVGTNTGALLLRRQNGTMTAARLPTQPPVATTVLFSPDGNGLAAFAATGQIVIYDLTNPDAISERVHLDVGGSSTGFFSPDSRSLFAIAGDRLLEVALDGREPLATATFGADEAVPLLARSDGTKVVVWSNGVESYDPNTGLPTPDEATLSGNVPQAYSADESTRIDYDFNDNTIVLADDHGSVRQKSLWSFDPYGLGSWNRDESIGAFVDGHGGNLVLVDLVTLEPIATKVVLTQVDDSGLVLSDDAAAIARSFTSQTDNAQEVEVYDLATGRLVVPRITMPAGAGTITAMTFNPDGRSLSFGDENGHIGNIDLINGRVEPDVYQGATGSVLWLTYTADGHYLLATLGSTSAVIWDTSSRTTVGAPILGTPSAVDVVISDSTFWWATSDQALHHLVVTVDGGLRQWNIDFATWPDLACERAGRNLTRAEWKQYMPTDDAYHQTCPQFASG
jgi:class 3 adenylate cyclase/WD40 repeat protein